MLARAREPASALWLLLLLALALRLVVASLTSGADYDIASYHIQAQTVLAHQNIYAVTNRYPYPPVWVWLTALAQWLANVTALPFVWLVRLPGIAGDCLIVALLQRCKGNRAALFYAVNPVAILITAGHGQFDGLVMALVVASWALWDRRKPGSAAWAALALGGAIALKGYPILLLPALLIGAAGWRQLAERVGLALLPLLASVLVYSAFFGLDPVMVSRVLGYSGPSWFGWSLYITTLLPALWPSSASGLLLVFPIITRLLIIAVPLLLVWRRPAWPLERLWLATLLCFYVLAPALSVQYLLWLLPLLAIIDLRRGWSYTAFSFLTALFFYLAHHPTAVPWGPAIANAAPFYIWPIGHWITNFMWWLYCLLFWRATLWQGKSAAAARERFALAPAYARSGAQRGLSAVKATAPDRPQSSDSSTPESASEPETGETRAES